jgi:hypothetical protein
MTTVRGEPSFDWAALVPRVVHPARVAIIEAMLWVGRPISATEMVQMIDEEVGVSSLSYHFRVLADRKVGVIEQVDRRQARGSEEKLYYFCHVPPAE